MGNRLIKKRYFGEALIIILVFLLVDGLIYILLGRHYRKNFTQEKLEMMIEGKSKWKVITNEPCKWAILGDPLATENSFIKLILNCPDGKNSTNTLDLRAISGSTFADLFDEYVRIQGIDRVEIDEKGRLIGLGNLQNSDDLFWTCFVNRKVTDNLRTAFKPRDQIECFYTTRETVDKVKLEFAKQL